MKKILVPTDFSDCANAAAQTAIEIAQKSGAAIDFLHLSAIPAHLVQSTMASVNAMSEELQKQLGLVQDQLNTLVHKAKQLGVEAHGYIVHNESVDEIYAHSKKHNISFIVVGSHGSKGVKELFLGSNAQRILRYAAVPVLVIKKALLPFEVKNMVFASSFREDVKGAFDNLLEIADMMKANVHLLYVNMPYMFEETKTTVARLRGFAQKYPERNLGIHIYNAFDEESGILQFAAEHKVELVALTTHGKSGWVQLLSPSIAESLVNHADIPVLSVTVGKNS